MNIKHILIILAHAFVGWLLCFATIGIGRMVTSMNTTLIIHAIGAPLYFAGVSLVYFRKFNYTTPLVTAVIFTAFVVIVDFFLVALVINRSMDMFTSLIGTWIPFILIFLSIWLTGALVTRSHKLDTAA